MKAIRLCGGFLAHEISMADDFVLGEDELCGGAREGNLAR